MQTFSVAIAGVIGVLLRYFTTLGMNKWMGPSFPYATLLVNVAGSFAIGVVSTLGL